MSAVVAVFAWRSTTSLALSFRGKVESFLPSLDVTIMSYGMAVLMFGSPNPHMLKC
jgi:hypothetical protein